MMAPPPATTEHAATARIAELEVRLREAEHTLEVIRGGGVDCLVIGAPGSESLYGLRTADRPYRVLVEGLNEGAAIASDDGVILYANSRLSTMLNAPLPDLIGSPATRLAAQPHTPDLAQLLAIGAGQTGRSTLDLATRDGTTIPVVLSVAALDLDGTVIRCLIATDLTDSRAAQARLAEAHQALRARDAFLERAQQVLGLGTWEYSLAEARLVISPHVHEISGIPAHKLDSQIQNIQTSVHPDDLPWVRDAYRQWLAGSDPYPIEHRLVHRDGSVRWVRQGAVIDRDTRERPVRLLGVIQDITERKTAEHALRDSEQQLRAMFDSTQEGLYRATIHGDLQMANPAAARLFGYHTTEQMLAETDHLTDLYADPADQVDLVDDVAAGRPRIGVQTRMRRRDGSTFHALVDAISVRNANGDIIAIQGMAYDISRRVQAEAEADQKRAELAALADSLEQQVAARTAELSAANRQLEAFTYCVSHDLRAPLRALHGFTELLLNECDDITTDRARHYLDRMLAAGARMTQLIEDLLHLSRLTRAEVNRQDVDLTRIAGETIDDLRGRDPDRHVDVHIAEDLRADADPALLRSVLENLLSNAWKFTRRRDDARIEFGRTETDEHQQCFFLRDNGVGFDMSYADQLFQPFRRLHPQEDFPGTGVGLASVEHVIQRHGGVIWAQAAPDTGATFYFTLQPTSPCSQNTPRPQHPRTTASPRPDHHPTSQSSNGARARQGTRGSSTSD